MPIYNRDLSGDLGKEGYAARALNRRNIPETHFRLLSVLPKDIIIFISFSTLRLSVYSAAGP